MTDAQLLAHAIGLINRLTGADLLPSVPSGLIKAVQSFKNDVAASRLSLPPQPDEEAELPVVVEFEFDRPTSRTDLFWPDDVKP